MSAGGKPFVVFALIFKNMKKPILQKILLLIVFSVLLLSNIYFVQKINTIEKRIILLEPKERSQQDCELVDGEEHIYKHQCLPGDYEPQTLVKLSQRASFLNSTQYVDVRAKLMVEELIADAEEDGICLTVSSSYRSVEDQEKAVQKLAQTGHKLDYIAVPGRSEHQTGLAVDFAACPMKNGKRDDDVERLELKKDFAELPEYRWLVDNAYKYDFEQSFTKDNKNETGYPEESWHWKLIIK